MRGPSPRVLIGALALCGIAGVAQAQPAVPFDGGYPVTRADQIYPLEALQAGARGVGYTVFRGHEVEPFDVEVLGILRGMLGPHRHIILARLSGEQIEKTGVISGMSGSPVYVDGRLVGAVSYRFGSFPKEPIAGITPIESMLEIHSPAGADRPASPPVASAQLLERSGPEPRPPARVGLPSPVAGGPRPIETPFILAGFSPSAARMLSEQLAAAGMVAVQGAGSKLGDFESPRRRGAVHANELASAGGVKAAPIAPGAPIAALLMRGDMYAAGTGTVTFVDGDLVLGFGHPFFGLGRVAFPMATAAILNTLASLQGSYKQSASALEVGTVQHDRLTAITGHLGVLAPMVPVEISVRQAGRTDAIETSVEIVPEPAWFPMMLHGALSSAASDRLGAEAGGTMDFSVVFELEGHTLRYADTFSAPPPSEVGRWVGRDVALVSSALMNNGIERPDLRRVRVRIEARPEPELADVEAVIPDRQVVAPGEELGVSVQVREYRGPARTLRMFVPIPKDAEGELELYVGGAIEVDTREAKAFGDRYPTTLNDLVTILSDRRPGRGLYGLLLLPRAGLRVGAQIMGAVPPSARLTLQRPGSALNREVTQVLGPKISVPHPLVLNGARTVTLRVAGSARGER